MATDLRSFNGNSIDLNNKSILITGGTGSFGKEFVRAVLMLYKPRRLIIYSRDELKQYEMSHEFNLQNTPCIRYFLGDVRDANRLEMAMRDVDYVIHAAALKHVPAAEYNPFECIHTNVLGAENVVNAAIRSGVKRVLALSTDKACNPANLYGASKLASDKIFSAANNLTGASDASFSVVRYGNVVGSRGSVVPFFQRLVKGGKSSLPITDPRMTRFWITLEQSVNFVMSCMDMMSGGEIFIPKIPSMNVVDLARAIGPGLELETIGIRPGEKLHEIMITADDARSTLDLGDRYVIEPTLYNWSNQVYMDKGAQRVAPDFSYASNTNSEWIDESLMLDMLTNHTAD